MTTNGVSFLGQSTAQTQRLKDLRTLMSDLQRQATTLKKNETLGAFGFDSLRLQRYRMDQGHLQGYLNNIQSADTRINLMSQSMTKASDLGRDLISSLSAEAMGGDPDLETVRTLAQNSLEFLQSLSNTELDGRYLFAGSSTTTQPFVNSLQLTNTFQTDVSNWLNGTTTTSQLLTNTNAYTATQLGFDPALSSAGSVSIRVSATTEVDYTVVAGQGGFDDLMRALAFAANLQEPNPATDVPTAAQLTEVINGIVAMAREGVEKMDAANNQLGAKYALLGTLKESQQQDLAMFQKLIDKEENVDPTEVIAKMTILQTQLEASYQVTNIVSQLSLVNFLDI